jgi:hypothetical protein
MFAAEILSCIDPFYGKPFEPSRALSGLDKIEGVRLFISVTSCWRDWCKRVRNLQGPRTRERRLIEDACSWQVEARL